MANCVSFMVSGVVGCWRENELFFGVCQSVFFNNRLKVLEFVRAILRGGDNTDSALWFPSVVKIALDELFKLRKEEVADYVVLHGKERMKEKGFFGKNFL